MRAAAGARIGGPEPRWSDPARVADHQRARVATALHRSGMPADEVRAILATHDVQLVRRYMELHRERLAERLDDQLRELRCVESCVTQVIRSHGSE